jgi:hypothetical protein
MKLKMDITFSEFVEAVHEAAKLEEAQLKKETDDGNKQV